MEKAVKEFWPHVNFAVSQCSEYTYLTEEVPGSLKAYVSSSRPANALRETVKYCYVDQECMSLR